MPAGIGYSFSPFQEDSQGQAPPAEQVQNAVQVLGLRMPTVAGARGIAPQPLLNSQGAGGLNIPGGLSLQQFLELLFGQMSPSLMPGGAQNAPSAASRPIPGIVPGQQPTTPGAPVQTGAPAGGKIPGTPEVNVPPPGGMPPSMPGPSMPSFDPAANAINRSNPLPGNRGAGGPLMQPYRR
jgi:hypothetical protein